MAQRRVATWFLFLAGAILAAAQGQAQTVSSTAPEARRIPLFDLARPQHSLEATVLEGRYGLEAVFELPTLSSQLRQAPDGSLHKVALTYLNEVARGRTGSLRRLYAADGFRAEEAEQAAAVYRALLRGRERLRLLRQWHFGAFRVLLIRVEGGGESKLLTVSLRGGEGGFRRADDWGKWQPVHGLFWYLARNLDQDLVGRHQPRDFAHSLSFEPPGGAPMRLSFDGKVYPAKQAWQPPSIEASVEDAAGFLRHAAAASQAEDTFLDLWRGKDRQRIAAELTAGERARMASWAEIGRVRDLLTVDLGEAVAHFYRDAGRPDSVQVALMTRTDGRLWLSRGIYLNIEQWVRSPLMASRVLALAGGSPGSP